MILTHFTGDMFADLKPGDALAHGCNCMGFFGAGVARIVKEKFPVNFENYRAECDADGFMPGACMLIKEKGVWVFNLATQFEPGANAQYAYVSQSVLEMGRQAQRLKIETVRIPQIGCGIGGLEWFKVQAILENVQYPLNLHVYTLAV